MDSFWLNVQNDQWRLTRRIWDRGLDLEVDYIRK